MLNELRTLLKADYQEKASGGGYILQEKAEPTFPKTKLLSGGSNMLLCKFDERTAQLLPFFNPIKGAHQMADYVAFVQHGSTCFVYTIELSTTKKKIRQRRPTEDFVRYIETVLKRLNNIGHDFVYRYLVVRKMPVPKGTTKPGKFWDDEDTACWSAGNSLNLVILSLP